MNNNTSFDMITRDCIKKNILKDFLSKHGGEIRGKGEGAKALLEVLLGLDIPKPVIREKLYEKYSDMPEVIDKLCFMRMSQATALRWIKRKLKNSDIVITT